MGSSVLTVPVTHSSTVCIYLEGLSWAERMFCRRSVWVVWCLSLYRESQLTEQIQTLRFREEDVWACRLKGRGTMACRFRAASLEWHDGKRVVTLMIWIMNDTKHSLVTVMAQTHKLHSALRKHFVQFCFREMTRKGTFYISKWI